MKIADDDLCIVMWTYDHECSKVVYAGFGPWLAQNWVEENFEDETERSNCVIFRLEYITGEGWILDDFKHDLSPCWIYFNGKWILETWRLSE